MGYRKRVTPEEVYPHVLGEQAEALKSTLAGRIVGQYEAVEKLVDALGSYWAGLSDPNRPIANFLFLGATGTGKTRTVEVLADALLGGEDRFTKIDCAEYSHGHEVAKLTGSPSGYVGYGDKILLEQTNINAWRKEDSYDERNKAQLSIILFDEIEKAHFNLWKLLLSILDKGSISLGNNRITDFSKSIIIMTSNLGSAELNKLFEGGFGFVNDADNIQDKVEKISIGAAKKHFSLEFWNRLDAAIVFRSLSKESVEKILSIELGRLQNRIIHSKEPFVMYVQEEARAALLSEGYSEKYGARELKRVLDSRIMHPIANLVLSKQVSFGDMLHIRYDGEFHFYRDRDAAKEVLCPNPLSIQDK